LGQLYEQTQQWEEAKRLTQQALNLVQAIRAPEIAYQWQWQMGRLLVKTANGREGNGSAYARAIASYTEAVNTLQSLRQDLVATEQDVQFSFRNVLNPFIGNWWTCCCKTRRICPKNNSKKTFPLHEQRLKPFSWLNFPIFFGRLV
jgi:hypothetical protein